MNATIFALAGLLHDIGKFAQRADVSLDQSVMLDQPAKNMAGLLCRQSAQGYYTHQHVVWTHWFLHRHRARFEAAGLLGEGPDDLIACAAYHHKPGSLRQAILTMADYWSSGIDRNDERSLAANPDHGRDQFRSVPMLSLFPQLATDLHAKGVQGEHGYSLASLGMGESIFPRPASELNLKESYKGLWASFDQAFQNIQSRNPTRFIQSVYALLRKYTWYIPASTIDYPKTSLFEHLKITGALAHCLGSYQLEHPGALVERENHRLALAEGHYPALLVCGDLSGIQSFIYNISGKMAMKSLKGRSFYVQLLSETIAGELTARCGGSAINQVYAAGGKFYLLLPNTDPVRQAIDIYEREIQEKLWKDLRGDLQVIIGSAPFAMKHFSDGLKVVSPIRAGKPMEVGELWGEVARQTSAKKHRRIQHLLTDRFNDFFEATGTGGDIATCQITAVELEATEAVTLSDENEASEIRVSPIVAEQIEIGASLYNAQAIAEVHPDVKTGFPLGVQSRWQFPHKDAHTHSIQQWVFMNQPDLEAPGRPIDVDASIGFRFFGGLPMAHNGMRALTLEELCQLRPDSPTTTKLGVLRMDVDNLGNLFMKGFSAREASFSALTTLSALLDQFFSGHLNVIRNSEAFARHVNIVYAGGDDVFAVGRWDKLLDFALAVRAAFQRFVCGRADISISGGLVVVPPKFPIAKAAQLAGEAEDAAKDYAYHTKDLNIAKNALTIFGIPLNWEHEMPFVVACKKDLVLWIHERRWLTKGFLMKLYEYYESYRSGDISWRWQSAYVLARMEKEARGAKEKEPDAAASSRDGSMSECFATFKNLLVTWSYGDQYRGLRFEALIAACRWAELEIRQLKQLSDTNINN